MTRGDILGVRLEAEADTAVLYIYIYKRRVVPSHSHTHTHTQMAGSQIFSSFFYASPGGEGEGIGTKPVSYTQCFAPGNAVLITRWNYKTRVCESNQYAVSYSLSLEC